MLLATYSGAALSREAGLADLQRSLPAYDSMKTGISFDIVIVIMTYKTLVSSF